MKDSELAVANALARQRQDDVRDFIREDQLIDGATYEVVARRFRTAVWDGEAQQFHGKVISMGREMVESDAHVESMGSVKPIRFLRR